MLNPPAAGLPRVYRGLAALSALAVLGAGCEGSGPLGAHGGPTAATSGVAAEETPIRTNVRPGARDVPVDTLVKVFADAGRLRSVTVRSDRGPVPGRLSAERARWVAAERLEPGTRYRVRVTAEGPGGAPTRSVVRFSTQALTLEEQTYPSVAPLDGETVGVGMPVVVSFDLPVRDQAAFERAMRVTSVPEQAGSWSWVSDTEAHWRPRRYWEAGTEVSVDIDVNGVAAGGGIYGQEDRSVDFTVGDAHIYKVDARTHRMRVYENGRLLRTLPITTGKPGFTTRSGIKVIMEKFAERRMNSETVGIPAGSAEAYDIDDVKWAMRLTYSGEFIHAAPWSVGSQGHANVSHGCTGLSTADAGWLYAMSRRGDVVEYVGTDRRMEPGNGYGDWNVDWADYRAGSALR